MTKGQGWTVIILLVLVCVLLIMLYGQQEELSQRAATGEILRDLLIK